jgi:hypothetical protein
VGELVPVDIGLLKIDGAIFHQVPGRDEADPKGNPLAPVVSTVEATLDDRLEFFLRDRLTRTFNDAAQPVLPDNDIVVLTPGIVEQALADEARVDIVGPFALLPALLHDVQAHNSPRGLLAVIRARCGVAHAIVLLKVEQERGLSFETRITDTEVSVDVVIEDGLVLTDKTKVFKAAVFWTEDDHLAGLVTDDQTGSVYTGPSSRFWLSDFLGCRYSREADVDTRSWVKATQRLVASDLTNPAEKDRVLSAMLTELHSNRASITPARFIENYVPAHAHDRARQRLLNEGAPTRTFGKSRSVSEQAPKKKRFLFDTGFEVTMPSEVVPDLGTEDQDDGTTVDVLTIRGKIRRVS